MLDLSLVQILVVVIAIGAIGFALGARLGVRALTTACVLLLVVAAVGIRLREGGKSGEILLLDVSWSMGGVAPPIVTELFRSGDLPATPTVYVFGQRTLHVPGPANDLPDITPSLAKAAGRGGSDLAGALRTASEVASKGDRITVVTDGRASLEGVAGTVTALRSRGVGIRLFAAGRRVRGDRRVTELRLPGTVREGSALAVRVGVAGPAGAEVELGLAVDGAKRDARRFVLPPSGRSTQVFRTGRLASGFHEIAAVLSPDEDDPAPENDWRMGGVIASGPRRARLVNAAGLRPSLQATGFDVEEGWSETDLASFDLVVVRDLPITAFDDGGEALRRYVESGGGLLVIGGPRAFGPGGWGGRPIEECLPVRSHPEDEGLFVAVLLDRSGTMGDPFARGDGPAKFESARTATRALIRRLPVGALALLVPFTREVLGEPAVVRLSAEPDRGILRRELRDTGEPAGGTSLVSPFRFVLRTGAEVRAEKRLVLVFSDGRVEGEADDDVRRAAAELRRAGYRLELFAVGEDADRALLDSLAGEGRRSTPVTEAGVLEDEFLSALFRLEGEDRVRQGSFTAVRTGRSGLAFAGPLALTGYVRTWAREAGVVWHALADGSPVTVGGRHGLGTTVVVTADPLGPWASDWPESGVLPALVEAATRPSSLTTARVEIEGDSVTAWLDVMAPAIESHLSTGLESIPIRLDAAGGGAFRGHCPPLTPGPARITLATPAGPVRAGLSVPFPAEFGESGQDPAGLKSLRDLLGEPRPGSSPGRDAAPFLAGLALVLFLGDRWVRLKRNARPGR